MEDYEDNPLQELDERFKAFVGQQDYDEFYSGVSRYFRFIRDTFPFNQIAQTLFKSNQSSVILDNTNDLYKSFVLNEPDPKYSISPATLSGSGISAFHQRLVSEAKKIGLKNKNLVILHNGETSKSICLTGKTTNCYPIKGRSPKRFEMVYILYKTKTGKSACEIADLLKKNGEDKNVQDKIKKEIVEVNKLFQENCKTSDKLIVHVGIKGKNIYSLNRDQFIFEIKK